MTQQENEIETTEAQEAREASTLERAMEGAADSDAPSLLEAAPAAVGAWVSETREVLQRHWGLALERARTRLEPAPRVADAPEVAPQEAPRAQESSARTPLHTLLGSAIVARAQDRGAAILLGSMRKLRTRLEHLEANLEAARPEAA